MSFDVDRGALSATVSALSPLRVVVPSLDGGAERQPVRGWPAHPASRPPAAGDQCLVAFDELDRLWITSWRAT